MHINGVGYLFWVWQQGTVDLTSEDMGFVLGWCTTGIAGGGTNVKIFHSSKCHRNVLGPSTWVLVAWHEARCGLVRREVLDLQKGRGRASTTSWKNGAVTYSRLEMGRDHDGLHHEVSTISAGVDLIWVIMDRLIKSAYFIPIQESIFTEKLDDIYIWEVMARHGVPISVVSGQDVHFTSRFWKIFHEELGTVCTSAWLFIRW